MNGFLGNDSSKGNSGSIRQGRCRGMFPSDSRSVCGLE